MRKTSLKLGRDTISSVVDHMNTDHHNACLDIARAFGPHKEAISATMLTIDATGMEFSIELPRERSDSPEANHVHTRVFFPKPLSRSSQIRGMMVSMAKAARSLLSG